jgi:ATP-dependent Clp protease ATP-binding subunit ClpB
MTSNLGSDIIQDMADGDYDGMKREVMGAVADHFRPEFINRIDESVVFHPLGAEQIRSIAEIQLQALSHRLEERELKLEISDAVFEQLSRVGFDPVYGARPLKRAIQQLVENPLAQAILEGEFSPGDKVFAALDGSSLKFASEAMIDRGPEPPTTKSLH